MNRFASRISSRIQFVMARLLLMASLGAGCLTVACTNGQSVVAGNYEVNGSTTTTSTGTNDSLTNFVTITTVVTDPTLTGTFDVEGDGTNSIGTQCTPAAQASSTPTSGADYQGTGASNCDCVFDYTDSAGAGYSVDVPTTYYEANMVQCPYNEIPAGVTQVSISLENITTGEQSNTVIFPLSAGSVSVDMTNIINYSAIQRYQCHDVVTICMPGSPNCTSGTGMYDPIQSENPDIAYPLDFYTGNLGGTYSLFAQAALNTWSCPVGPIATTDPNLRIWSVSPDSNGSDQIFPVGSSAFNRSTFYVSNQPSGVFTVPLNTYIAPTLYGNGSNGQTTIPPSGYGAPTASTGTNSEGYPTEGCPTTVQIPAGYQWAKLWMFRADLSARYFLTSQAVASVDIGCNPPLDSTGQVSLPIKQCSNGGTHLGTTYASSVPPAGSADIPLADRVLLGEGTATSGNIACVNIDGTVATFPCSTREGPGCWTGTETTAIYGEGTDFWAQIAGSPVTSASANVTDPLNIYNGNGTQGVPKDLSPGSQDLDATNGVVNPRYDFLYTVSPVTVMAYQMAQTSSNGVNNIYTPYRFLSASDCQSNEPNSPAFSGDCNPEKIIHYGLQTQDVSASATAGTNAQNVYPLCVLQPIPTTN